MTSTPAVLVIDDNTDLAENIAEILEDCGVEVRLAENADKALEAFDERRWSLVVTDVRMPGRNGIQLLELIKERSPGTPVLVMTGYADRDTVNRAHESGALAVLNKPINLDSLLGLIEGIAGAKNSVLVVEDDVNLIGNLTDILCEEPGMLPHPATSVALARRLAAAVDFQVALIDLRLPDGDGITLARELLEREDGSLRSIIIMTGYPEQIDKLRDAGVDVDEAGREGMVVLTKPFPVPSLLEHLREMV